jgi:hypothetical protein
MNLPSGEPSSVDYFSIRSTNNVLSHLFSSTGNYYCGNNLNGIFVPKNSGGYISGINGNYMIINAPTGGGVQFNNNGSEMIKIYQNSGINYIGTGSNKFIINPGEGSIISSSFHSSPNYSNNSYVISNYAYGNSYYGTNNNNSFEYTVATFTCAAGNKIHIDYYCQFGTWASGTNANNYSGQWTITIKSYAFNVYKNGVLIRNYPTTLSNPLSSSYSIAANASINSFTWMGNKSFYVDNSICTTDTVYTIKFSVSMFSANQNSNTWNSYNGSDAKFTTVVHHQILEGLLIIVLLIKDWVTSPGVSLKILVLVSIYLILFQII